MWAWDHWTKAVKIQDWNGFLLPHNNTDTYSEEATGSSGVQVQADGNHADNEELIGSRGSGPGNNRP
jgi:hypothetical protein